MSIIRIPTAQNIDLEYDTAGLGERIVAFIIDTLVRGSALIILFILLYLFNAMIDWLVVILYIPFALYFLLSELFYNGQSIGKKIMKIRVVCLDGSPPGIGQYLIRWLFRLVDITISLGLVAITTIATSARQQRLGDMLAGTTLVSTRPRGNMQYSLNISQEAHYEVVFPEVTKLTDRDIQLIEDILSQLRETNNLVLSATAAQRIKFLLHIESSQENQAFLQTILTDYNHLARI
ncbi:MAG TPA: RDD family protein [Chitinophagaceae bacterium]|nr:RDD family protein [Chitinophagaceae bacterium]